MTGEQRCYPDMRCESTIILWPDDECIDVHCVLEDGHDEGVDDGAYVHTDGNGTWWNNDNDVEFQ